MGAPAPDGGGVGAAVAGAAIKSQLAAAAKAGIPVVTCSPGPEAPTPTTYAMICSRTTQPDGVNIALWAIHDSGGKAHIVDASVSAFPILQTAVDGTAETVKKYCPGCTHDVLDFTVDDIGAGQVGSKIVAYLQSHPDVNYVNFAFSDLSTGVPEALKAAGLANRVTIMGNQGGEAQMKGIAEGSGQAWTAFPNKYESWEMVDAAIRLADDGKLPPNYQKQIDALPTYLVATKQEAQALAPTYQWDGPKDYHQQFEELWKVG